MTRRLTVVVAGMLLLLGQLLIVTSASGAGSGGTFTAKLNGLHENPPVATNGTGSANVVISPDGTSIFFQVTYTGLSGPAVASHIHLGAVGVNGPIIFPFKVTPSPITGTLTAADFTGAGGITFDQAVDAIRNGGTYVNIHTAAHPGGEIRGQLTNVATPAAYTMTADQPEAVPAGKPWSFDDFFPRTLTVTQGSTVTFNIEGFHTATLLPQGISAVADTLANGVVSADTDDTVPNPNGTSHSTLNVQNLGTVLPNTTCGAPTNPCIFDGSQIIQQGAPLGPPETPATIYITAGPGTYVVHCRVHPAMTGAITVVPPGSQSISSVDDVAATIKSQADSGVAAAQAVETSLNHSASTTNKDGTHTWTVNLGAETPDHHVVLLEMLPAKISIKPGDKVNWKLRGVQEPHTVTFPTDINTDTLPVCEGTNGTDTPATPTVIPPTGLGDFACAGGPPEFENGGGNGISTVTSTTTVSDSGLVTPAEANAGFGLPANATLHTWTVSFKGAAKGTYTYVCQIHDGMAGIIVVK